MIIHSLSALFSDSASSGCRVPIKRQILKLVLIQLAVRPFFASSYSNNRERSRVRQQHFTENRCGMEDRLSRLQQFSETFFFTPRHLLYQFFM